MLAPMPLAAALGLGRRTEPVIVPMGLSLNGNAITVSNALYEEMLAGNSGDVERGGMDAAKALKIVVRKRQEQGRDILTFGMVFPFSAHNYDLRCWMASAGVDPDSDVNLIVVPPPLLSESLRSGKVDGFFVGHLGTAFQSASGDGVIIATKEDLWASSPEKVLGVKKQWADFERTRFFRASLPPSIGHANGSTIRIINWKRRGFFRLQSTSVSRLTSCYSRCLGA